MCIYFVIGVQNPACVLPLQNFSVWTCHVSGAHSDMWPLATLSEGTDKVSDEITSKTTRLGLFPHKCGSGRRVRFGAERRGLAAPGYLQQSTRPLTKARSMRGPPATCWGFPVTPGLASVTWPWRL